MDYGVHDRGRLVREKDKDADAQVPVPPPSAVMGASAVDDGTVETQTIEEVVAKTNGDDGGGGGEGGGESGGRGDRR